MSQLYLFLTTSYIAGNTPMSLHTSYQRLPGLATSEGSSGVRCFTTHPRSIAGRAGKAFTLTTAYSAKYLYTVYMTPMLTGRIYVVNSLS